MIKDAPVSAILPAVDLDRAKRFYTEKLGLEPEPIAAQGTMVFRSGSGTRLVVYQRQESTKAEHTVAGWMVEDIQQTVKDLNRKGIVCEQYNMPGLKTDEYGIATMVGEKAAWFKDTEGNILAIMELG